MTRTRPFKAAAWFAVLGAWLIASLPAMAQILPPLPGELIVTITSPSSGATVSGTITVSASVSPVGVLVGGVQFKLDGANLGAEDTSSPYAVSWNTANVGNGSHTLRAVARDALGLQFTSNAVTVTVSNAPPPDTTPPTVSVTSPANGATVSGTITVSASASDNVGVAGVQFTVDGANLGSEDTGAPYSVSWNTANVSNGSHTLRAVARDAAGNRTTSAAVTVTASNAPPPDTTPPTVSVTSPANGATVSGTITVSASASDAGGVITVQFLVDGAELSRDTSAPYSTAWDTRAVANGTHALQARAQDTAGNIGESSVVTVTVSNGTSGTPTRVEEDSPSVTYTGSWISQSRGDLSGGTVVESLETDATASLTFTGTGVSWIGFKAPWAGIAQVFLDGTLRATVDGFSPIEQAQAVMYSVSGLTSGSHTIRIRVTGTWNPSGTSAWVVLDAFDVFGGSGGGGGATPPTRFEESAATLAPAEAWFGQTSGTIGVSLSGDFAAIAADAGATASFPFTGTGVSWIGFKCEQCGIATVRLDGAVVATVDTYAPSRPAASGPMFTRTGLAAGSHTLVIEVTGTANAASSGTFIVVDAFDVTQ